LTQNIRYALRGLRAKPAKLGACTFVFTCTARFSARIWLIRPSDQPMK
jgi:hypothetical protein